MIFVSSIYIRSDSEIVLRVLTISSDYESCNHRGSGIVSSVIKVLRTKLEFRTGTRRSRNGWAVVSTR